MNNIKKIIVIGLGSMGKRRLRHLKSMNESFEIIGCDSNEERCKQVETDFAIKTINELNDNILKECDCAFVSTSPLSHASIITKALNNDCNVFTELNLVSDGYEENIKLANDKKKVLFLSSTSLYKKELIYIIDKVKELKEPVNYLYHFGQYLPDWHPWENYKDFFVGNKRSNGCREIMAIEFPWLTEAFGKITKFNAISSKNTSLNIDYPDNYLLILEHENGNKGCFSLDLMTRKATKKLEIFGEHLYITWNGTPESLCYYDFENKKDVNINTGNSFHEVNYAKHVVEEAYRDEIIEFFNAVRNNTRPRYSFIKDFEILKIIDKIEGISK